MDIDIYFGVEVTLDELKWEVLTEIQGRWEADIIKALLAEHDIDSEFFQETIGQLIPTSLDLFGLVTVYVPKEQAEAARLVLKAFQDSME